MREIKFRAWDELNNIMTSSNISIDFIHNMCHLFDEEFKGNPTFINSFIALQYTGLKDRNGKEIYEGDIVSITFPNGHSNDCVSVDENSYCITKVMFDYQGVYFVEHDGTWFYAPALISDDCMFEVIGNIYESKDLLK